MEGTMLKKVKRRASKRVDWLGISLAFIFIGILPLPTKETPMNIVQIIALVIGSGIIVVALMLRMSGEIPSFRKAYKKACTVWGLWEASRIPSPDEYGEEVKNNEN